MSRKPRSIDYEAEEAVPEADRLEGFPHPRETERLFGQDEAVRTLAAALNGGRMHHAWLLTGPEGVGKATLAYRFARAALSEPADRGPGLTIREGSSVEAQLRVLSHPGLIVIRRAWQRDTKRHTQGIPVDEVRRIKGFLQHSGGDTAYRVVIIDRAEEMAPAAANAVLKSLEEPPPRAVFLLVSSEPGRLLPTIHSRCRRLELKPLGDADLAAAMAAASGGAEVKDLATVTALAEGSVRRGLTLVEGGAVEMHAAIVGLLAGLPKLDGEAVHKLADGLTGAANEQKFRMFFSLLQGVLARALRAAATGEALRPVELRLAGRFAPERLAAWAEAYEQIARDKAEAMTLNLDRKSLVLLVFERLRGVAG